MLMSIYTYHKSYQYIANMGYLKIEI